MKEFEQINNLPNNNLERENLLKEIDRSSTFIIKSDNRRNPDSEILDTKLDQSNSKFLKDRICHFVKSSNVIGFGEGYKDSYVKDKYPNWYALNKKFDQEDVFEFCGFEQVFDYKNNMKKPVTFGEVQIDKSIPQNEEIYSISYFVRPLFFSNSKLSPYIGAKDERAGNHIFMEIFIPKSLGDKAYKNIQNDPKLIRDLVKEKLSSAKLIDKDEWEENPDFISKSLFRRPPYEKWNGKIYIQEPLTNYSPDPKGEIKEIKY